MMLLPANGDDLGFYDGAEPSIKAGYKQDCILLFALESFVR